MKKIIIITGMTGSGKSKFTKNILKNINSELIIADIQQFYYNFPILSNQDLNNKDCKFLSKFDCFDEDNRINSNYFKNLILKEINDVYKINKIPILEGGSYFYINYLLTNIDNKINNNDEIENDLKNILEKTDFDLDKINKLYPDFKYDLSKNDKYRIKSYLKNYLYNNIKIDDNNENNKDNIPLKNNYDVRGFCFYYDKKEFNYKLIKRALEMIKEGCIFEVYKYKDKKFCKDKFNFPIGYKEINNFWKKYNKNLSIKLKIKLIKNLIKDIVDKTRKYAGNQLKYMKKYFKDFNWIKIEQNTNYEKLKEEILKSINVPKEEFEKNKLNIELNEIIDQKKLWNSLEEDINNLILDYEDLKEVFSKLDLLYN